MAYQDKMKILPSGIYKSYLLDRIFTQYTFRNPILEIGCGTGEFFERLKEYNLEGEAIDMNQETVNHCRKKCKALGLKLKMHQKNFFDYNIDSKFNTIFMFEILEHIEDDQQALQKIADLLEKKGCFLMSVPAKQALFSQEDKFQGHLRRYEKKDLIEKHNKASLTIKLFWCYNPFPYVTHSLMRIKKKGAEGKNEDVVQKTKDSSHSFFPATKKLVDIFYPIYSRLQFLLKFQNMFLNSDFGAHYLVLSQKLD